MQSAEQPWHRLDLDEYLAARDKLPGWFDNLDALLFQCFDRIRRESGVRGDLLEIGVYQGKSAVLLGYFVRELKMYAATGKASPAVRAGLNQLIATHSGLRMEFHSLLGTELAQIYHDPLSKSTAPRAKRLYWSLVAAVREVRRKVKRRLFPHFLR